MKNVWFGFLCFLSFLLKLLRIERSLHSVHCCYTYWFLFMGINYARYHEPLNLGVDFSGGVVFTVTLPENKDASELTRIALEQASTIP